MPTPISEPPALPPGTLRIIPLGGLGEVGRNMTVFEIDGKLLIVDCGVLFPENEQPGVDLILPDITPIRDRLDDVVAVVLTHGHVDHIWSVVPVCSAHRVPAYIHPDDRELFTSPGRGFGLPVGREIFPGMTFVEPDDVRQLSDGEVLDLAGLALTVDHAPGHTPGSVTFRLSGTDEHEPVLFSGDLLFAGSIGRTDLPGGDYPTILRSLARVCLPLPDETLVLPGHMTTTTIGRERATNPFLAEAAAMSGGAEPTLQPPSRGL
jgi:glyoxylase-like metal-dependent hydrolase (beta-lactamase superfamily II)